MFDWIDRGVLRWWAWLSSPEVSWSSLAPTRREARVEPDVVYVPVAVEVHQHLHLHRVEAESEWVRAPSSSS